MKLMLAIVLSAALFGCATAPMPAQQEAIASVGIASAIERTTDPAKTARLVVEIATMPLTIENVASAVKERVGYYKLTPSIQLAIESILEELDRQFAVALTTADKDATLALWRRAAIAAAERFLPHG